MSYMREPSASPEHDPEFVSQWDKFMHPSVDWISEPEYDRVFNELTGATDMGTEAGFTASDAGQYPAFVNISRVDEKGVQITVRGASEDGRKPGPLARMVIHEDDYYQLVADANRLTAPGKGKDEAAAAPAGDLDLAVGSDAIAPTIIVDQDDPRLASIPQIASAGDPLGLRGTLRNDSDGDDGA